MNVHERAAEIILERGWHQGSYFPYTSGAEYVDQPVCVMGAYSIALAEELQLPRNTDDLGWPIGVALENVGVGVLRAVAEAIAAEFPERSERNEHAGNVFPAWPPFFNDDAETSQEDILLVIKKAGERECA